MNSFKEKYKNLLFVLKFSLLGLFLGAALSSLNSVVIRSIDNQFLLRLGVGVFCGGLASTIHLFVIAFIDALTRGRYRQNPLAHAFQFSFIAYLLFIAVELTLFRYRLHEPSHKFWILACTLLVFVISTFVFLYYSLTEMIGSRLSILKKLHLGAIESLVAPTELRDPKRAGHSKRVAAGCRLISSRIGLNKGAIETLRRAALMHDIGKIKLDERLLEAEGGSLVDPEELAEMRLHPLIAEKILAPLKMLTRETQIIKTAHFFGSLVKLRKKHKEESGIEFSIRSLHEHILPSATLQDLPIEARILAVVDCFDTLTQAGSESAPLTEKSAIELLKSESGISFDEQIVNVLSTLIETGEWPPKDLHEQHEEDPFAAIDLGIEVRKVAMGIRILNTFYYYMGIGRHRATRSFVLSILSGIFAGIITGLFIYATTTKPQWVILFSIQGFLIGFIAWIIGFPIEYLLAKNYPKTLWEGPLGAGLGFFLSGSVAGIISYYFIVYPQVDAPSAFDGFTLLYCATVTILSATVGVLYRYLQDSSYRLIKNQRRLQKTYIDLVYALSFAIEAKDPYTKGHSEKVSGHSLNLGRLLKLSKDDLDELEKAALFHDIGKLGISQKIIQKTSKLTDEEYEIIKTHPAIGAEIIEPVKFYKDLSPFVRGHHESFDGRGYPEKRKKEEIPLFARIIAIADSYDAMVSDRAYRKGLPHEAAIAELEKNAGTQFDPDLVNLFIKTFDHNEGTAQ